MTCAGPDGKIPLIVLSGITPDISIILLFTFYQPVLHGTHDQHAPTESEERAAYCAGFGSIVVIQSTNSWIQSPRKSSIEVLLEP